MNPKRANVAKAIAILSGQDGILRVGSARSEENNNPKTNIAKHPAHQPKFKYASAKGVKPGHTTANGFH